jgi:hypothetical protein
VSQLRDSALLDRDTLAPSVKAFRDDSAVTQGDGGLTSMSAGHHRLLITITRAHD